jgi:hypothetical protein
MSGASTRDGDRREISPEFLAGVQQVMTLFVEDDLAKGVPAALSLHCHACQRGRPAPGFICYEQYQFCNACATEYEVAVARRLVQSVGQFLRDRRFGEEERYRLPVAVPA